MDRFARTGDNPRDGPVEAKGLLLEMFVKGFADVAIVDSAEGAKAYTASEFARRYSSNAHNVRNEGD